MNYERELSREDEQKKNTLFGAPSAGNKVGRRSSVIPRGSHYICRDIIPLSQARRASEWGLVRLLYKKASPRFPTFLLY